MLRHFRILALLTLLVTEPLNAQSYIWPTDASRYLTSSFAEFRPGHFHAGIDIKTWGREGYKVYATRSGYIWRIRVSPFGYGKVIYQKLDTGEIAVYAHLQRFMAPLERRVKQEQKRRGRYSLTLTFRRNEFPLRQGQLIGYTGRTGIGYPHLHFELRKNENTPFNPLHRFSEVVDQRPPIAKTLAVLPLHYGSQVEGHPTARIFPLKKVGAGRYTLDHPIQVWGLFAMALEAEDYADGVPNRFAVYKVSLAVDNDTLYKATYDWFTYDKTDLISLDRNYYLLSRTGRRFYNLFVENGNTLPFYEGLPRGSGLIYTSGYTKAVLAEKDIPISSTGPREDLTSIFLKRIARSAKGLARGKHDVVIGLEDFAGNGSEISFQLEVVEKIKPEDQWIPLQLITHRPEYFTPACRWQILDENNLWQPIPVPEYVFPSYRDGADDESGQGVELPSGKLIKIETESSFPVFAYKANGSRLSPELTTNILIKDPVAVFTFRPDSPFTAPFRAVLKRKSRPDLSLNVIFHNEKEATAEVPAHQIANDSVWVEIFPEGTENTISTRKWFFREILQSESTILRAADRHFRAVFPRNLSNQTVYASLTKIPFQSLSLSLPGDSLTPAYHLEPTDVPFFRNVKLIFCLSSDIERPQQLGIYRPNPVRKSWDFVGNTWIPERGELTAEVGSLGIFTVLRDEHPPIIEFVQPRPGKVLATMKPQIKVRYDDDLSGVGGEVAFRMFLDDNLCIAELDPELKLLIYHPDEPLAPGSHKLVVTARDRAGNVTQATCQFMIKEKP